MGIGRGEATGHPRFNGSPGGICEEARCSAEGSTEHGVDAGQLRDGCACGTGHERGSMSA